MRFVNSAGAAISPPNTAVGGPGSGQQCVPLRVIQMLRGGLVSLLPFPARSPRPGPLMELMEPGTFRRPVVDQSPRRPRPDRAGLEW
jgi:hypothetical protein